jgi:ABC-2 type transport system ATP-binding protein
MTGSEAAGGAMRDRFQGAGGSAPSAGTELAVATSRLVRYFGKKRAVGELSLRVPRGSTFALLGRNGSGKTTTIRLLLGLLEPTRGSAAVLGRDSRSLDPGARARVGYLPEDRPLHGWMRVRECGEYQSRFYPRWRDEIFRSVVSLFRLDPRARAGVLSRGERAGLALAMALAPEPELLILDDPTANLDPVARRAVLEALVGIAAGPGRTIFFTSHLTSDEERVADHIGILERGSLRASCPLDTFRRRVRRYVVRYSGAPPEVPRIPGLLQAVRRDKETQLTVVVPDAAIGGADAPASDGARERDPTAGEILRLLGRTATGAALGHGESPLRIDEAPLSLEDALVSYLAERGERPARLDAGGLGGQTDGRDETYDLGEGTGDGTREEGAA